MTVGYIESVIRQIQYEYKFDSGLAKKNDPSFNAMMRADAGRCALIMNQTPKRPNLRICEVGFGYGAIAIPIRKCFPHAKIYALESPTRINANRGVYDEVYVKYDITMLLADLTEERIKAPKMDVVIFSEIMEHISPAKIIGILRNLRGILKPDGALLLTTPNILRIRNRLRFLIGRDILSSPVDSRYGLFGHIREYSHAEVYDILEAAGFEYMKRIPCAVRYPILATRFDKFISAIGGNLAKRDHKFEDFMMYKARIK